MARSNGHWHTYRPDNSEIGCLDNAAHPDLPNDDARPVGPTRIVRLPLGTEPFDGIGVDVVRITIRELSACAFLDSG